MLRLRFGISHLYCHPNNDIDEIYILAKLRKIFFVDGDKACTSQMEPC